MFTQAHGMENSGYNLRQSPFPISSTVDSLATIVTSSASTLTPITAYPPSSGPGGTGSALARAPTLVLTNCVLENGNNFGTSVHQVNFTVFNRPLVAMLVRHWAATTQSLSIVFKLVIQKLQILIFLKERVNQYVKLAILRSQSSTFHILVNCTRYSAERQIYFGVDILKNVFENVAFSNIIAYVKDIDFYNRI